MDANEKIEPVANNVGYFIGYLITGLLFTFSLLFVLATIIGVYATDGAMINNWRIGQLSFVAILMALSSFLALKGFHRNRVEKSFKKETVIPFISTFVLLAIWLLLRQSR